MGFADHFNCPINLAPEVPQAIHSATQLSLSGPPQVKPNMAAAQLPSNIFKKWSQRQSVIISISFLLNFHFAVDPPFKPSLLQYDQIEMFFVICQLEHLLIIRSLCSVAHFYHKAGRFLQCIEAKKNILKNIFFR